jgi:hypothetical protein
VADILNIPKDRLMPCLNDGQCHMGPKAVSRCECLALLAGRFTLDEMATHHATFEVFTAVTMKNVVFWDIKTQFVLHRHTFHFRYRDQPVNAM